MARRKFAKRRSGGFKKFAKRASKSGSSENLMVLGLAAGAYGFARPYVEQWIAPVTSKIPIGGQYVDELALGTLGYFAARGKFGSNKYMKAAGKAVFMIEAARIGSGAGSMMGSGSGNGSAGNLTLG